MQQTNSLKPASRSSAVPMIQAARPIGIPETTVAAPDVMSKLIVVHPSIKLTLPAEETSDTAIPPKPIDTKIENPSTKLVSCAEKPGDKVLVHSKLPGTKIRNPIMTLPSMEPVSSAGGLTANTLPSKPIGTKIGKLVTTIPSTKSISSVEEARNVALSSKPVGTKIGSVRRKLPLGPIQVESRPVSEIVSRRSSIVPPTRIGVPSVGPKVGSNSGPLSPNYKTQPEERLLPIPNTISHERKDPTTSVTSPTTSRIATAGGIPRPTGSAIPRSPRT
ncbi:hypothetical protein BDQ17DRAFT_444543 [Cyathus striatus]|nr:hypothetical protein BDQ17DRAFT_444543 [Cyathus striatus]